MFHHIDDEEKIMYSLVNVPRNIRAAVGDLAMSTITKFSEFIQTGFPVQISKPVNLGLGICTGKPIWMFCQCPADYVVWTEPVHMKRTHVQLQLKMKQM